MSDFTTVFETLKGLLPIKTIESFVTQTNADYRTKKFSDRDSKIFKTIFQYTQMALNKNSSIGTMPNAWGQLKVLDSTTIRLCVSLFPWAHYRKSKVAVKVHTLFDIVNECPEDIIVTDDLLHDKEKMNSFITKPGTTYIMDRAYVDYKEFDKFCEEGIYFISRLKKNAVIEILNVNGVAKDSNVLSDKEVVFGGFYTRMKHPLRIIEVIDSASNEPFYIVTNRFDLKSEEISQIYPLRWKIELFFKWIKQHLKIKKFYGTSYNAVLNQLYSALILYCLLKLMHLKLGLDYDFLKIVRLISNGLFNRFSYMKDLLIPTKQSRKKRQYFSWKQDFNNILKQYNLDELMV